MKKFCIAGPIDPQRHYFIPHRLNLKQISTLIEDQQYFVLHALRQSGKTTAIDELNCLLNKEGKYAVLYINIEAAQAARDKVQYALISIVDIIAQEIDRQFPNDREVSKCLRQLISTEPVSLALLTHALSILAESANKPIVLFIDEIDALIGDSLLSVLHQIRAGFKNRPKGFPHSLCLVGLRDVRDYRIWSQEQGVYVSTSSPFNIKAESLTIANFSKDQIEALYNQHTEATGQVFTSDAVDYVYDLTQGQPWLVNALASEACFRDVLDRTQSITKDTIERAKEQLIIRQDTHIDSLLDKLNEPRVLGIIDAIISGKSEISTFDLDDVRYVYDLGLIKKDGFEIANPIYKEIIPRALTSLLQRMIPNKSVWYLDEQGNLNMSKLLAAFTTFFREHSGSWGEKFPIMSQCPTYYLWLFYSALLMAAEQSYVSMLWEESVSIYM